MSKMRGTISGKKLEELGCKAVQLCIVMGVLGEDSKDLFCEVFVPNVLNRFDSMNTVLTNDTFTEAFSREAAFFVWLYDGEYTAEMFAFLATIWESMIPIADEILG